MALEWDVVEENRKKLEELLEDERASEICQDNKKYLIEIGRTGDYEGYFEIVEDNEWDGHYSFDGCLGPANSKKLIEFLLTLEAEPEWDEDLR